MTSDDWMATQIDKLRKGQLTAAARHADNTDDLGDALEDWDDPGDDGLALDAPDGDDDRKVSAVGVSRG